MDIELVQIEDVYFGEILRSIQALVVQNHDQTGRPEVEGILLHFDKASIVIQSVNDTSELMVRTGTFKPDCELEALQFYSELDLSEQKPFIEFINQPLENWWSARNEKGYTDGFMVTFKSNDGLFFIAMNNIVSVNSFINKKVF